MIRRAAGGGGNCGGRVKSGADSLGWHSTWYAVVVSGYQGMASSNQRVVSS